MSALGVVRALLTWLVGGYLLALATGGAGVAVLALSDHRLGPLEVLLSGPLALLVLTPLSGRRVRAALALGGAEPQVAATRDVVRARGDRHAVGWVAPALPRDTGLAVRGWRRVDVVLPAGPEGPARDPSLAVAGRRERSGTASLLPLQAVVSAALRGWVELLRFTAAPWSDRDLSGWARARMFYLPLLSPLVALLTGVAWVATLATTLLVGPRAVRDLVVATRTGAGPLLRRRRVHGEHLPFGDSPVTTLGEEVLEPTGAEHAARRRVGLLGLPTSSAAAQAPFTGLAHLAAGVLLALLLPQAATLLLGTDDPGAPLAVLGVFVPLLAVVQVSATRTLLADLVPDDAGTADTAVGVRRSVRGPGAPVPSASSPHLRRSGLRDLAGMWPFWIAVLVVAALVAGLVAMLVGLVGRVAGATDVYREAAFLVALPVVWLVLVGWTLHAVLRQGDPLDLVEHTRSVRGLPARGRGRRPDH